MLLVLFLNHKPWFEHSLREKKKKEVLNKTIYVCTCVCVRAHVYTYFEDYGSTSVPGGIFFYQTIKWNRGSDYLFYYIKVYNPLISGL